MKITGQVKHMQTQAEKDAIHEQALIDTHARMIDALEHGNSQEAEKTHTAYHALMEETERIALKKKKAEFVHQQERNIHYQKLKKRIDIGGIVGIASIVIWVFYKIVT